MELCRRRRWGAMGDGGGGRADLSPGINVRRDRVRRGEAMGADLIPDVIVRVAVPHSMPTVCP